MRGLESTIFLVQTHRSLKLHAVALVVALISACAAPSRGPSTPQPSTMPPTSAPRPTDPWSQPPGRYEAQDPSLFPRTAAAVSGPAVVRLLEQARTELAAGKPEQAIAALETALNIEPRNPFVWQQLASTHLAQQLPDQAEHKAQRSNSFARGNPWIEVENWRLIAAARQERGDLTGARQARERMTEIQAVLED
jgi:hypothetical protein